MITLNIIEKYFTDFAAAHYQLKYYGSGDLSEVSQDEAVTYPLMWATEQPLTVDGNNLYYNYSVLIGDRLEDGDGNRVEVLSDSLQICKDLLSSIRQVDDFGWDIVKSVTITPFVHRFKDRIAGHIMTVSIQTDFNYDECAIPQSGSPTPPPTLCQAATITINGVSYTLAESGETTNIVVKDTDGVAVGEKIASEWIVPASTGGGFTLNQYILINDIYG